MSERGNEPKDIGTPGERTPNSSRRPTESDGRLAPARRGPARPCAGRSCASSPGTAASERKCRGWIVFLLEGTVRWKVPGGEGREAYLGSLPLPPPSPHDPINMEPDKRLLEDNCPFQGICGRFQLHWCEGTPCWWIGWY